MPSIEIDYTRVNEIVDNSQKLYPNIDKYVLWILACDYYIKEELKQEVPDDEDEKTELYERCKQELKKRTYEGVKVEDPTSSADVSQNLLEDISENIVQ